jgi:hypothetical protein
MARSHSRYVQVDLLEPVPVVLGTPVTIRQQKFEAMEISDRHIVLRHDNLDEVRTALRRRAEEKGPGPVECRVTRRELVLFLNEAWTEEGSSVVYRSEPDSRQSHARTVVVDQHVDLGDPLNSIKFHNVVTVAGSGDLLVRVKRGQVVRNVLTVHVDNKFGRYVGSCEIHRPDHLEALTCRLAVAGPMLACYLEPWDELVLLNVHRLKNNLRPESAQDVMLQYRARSPLTSMDANESGLYLIRGHDLATALVHLDWQGVKVWSRTCPRATRVVCLGPQELLLQLRDRFVIFDTQTWTRTAVKTKDPPPHLFSARRLVYWESAKSLVWNTQDAVWTLSLQTGEATAHIFDTDGEPLVGVAGCCVLDGRLVALQNSGSDSKLVYIIT